MRICLAAVGVLCALGLSGCSTREAPSQPANAQDIPRAADGKPDFSGVWAGPGFRHTGKDTDSATVRLYTDSKMASFTPEGKSLFFKPHSGNVRIDDPTAVCLPNGLTRQIPSPYAQQFIQTADQLVILYEYMHFFRVIPIGAPNRAHAADGEPTYMGDSIGWWNLARQPVRQTDGGRIVNPHVARMRLVEERLALGCERRHVGIGIEPHRRAVGILAGVLEAGTRPDAAEIRLAVRGARDVLNVRPLRRRLARGRAR